MNRSTRFARTLLACLLAVLMLLAIAPLALAEEASEPDPNNFTGTYEIGGSTGTGKKFAAVIVIWDQGTRATVRGVVPKIGKALSWSFPVEQISDTEYLVSGSVWIPVVGSGSGAATITKKGDGYEIGGSGNGTFFSKSGSATFGGARVSGATDTQVSTALINDAGEQEPALTAGDEETIKAPDAVVALSAGTDGDLPPVGTNTKATVVGSVAALVTAQLLLELIVGGKPISKTRLGELLRAGQDTVAAGGAGSSFADARDALGDVNISAGDAGGGPSGGGSSAGDGGGGDE